MLLHGQLVKRLTHRPLKATLTGSNPVLITIEKQTEELLFRFSFLYKIKKADIRVC